MTAFQEIWNPWLIGPFLWLVGIGGMTAVAYVLLKWSGVEEKRRELSWVAFISIVLALAFVIADLSRPWNMPSAIMSAVFGGTFGWTRSWMSVGIALLLVMLVLTFLVALRHTGAGALRPLVDAKWYDALLLLMGVAVTIYSGFLIAAAPGVPFWNTALIPVLWIISSSVCATSVVILLLHSKAVSKVATKYSLALDTAELLAIFALVSLALYGGSRAARASAIALAYGELAAAFWIGVVALGILAPLLDLYHLKRENRYIATTAAVVALLSALMMKVLVIQAGVFEPLA